jgi:integrase
MSKALAFVAFELLGLRFIELRGLRWKDICFNEKKLRVEDSWSSRQRASPSILPAIPAPRGGGAPSAAVGPRTESARLGGRFSFIGKSGRKRLAACEALVAWGPE